MAPTPGSRSRTWIHFFGSKKLNFSILNVVKCLLVMEKKEQSKMEEQGRGGKLEGAKNRKKHHNHTIMRGGGRPIMLEETARRWCLSGTDCEIDPNTLKNLKTCLEASRSRKIPRIFQFLRLTIWTLMLGSKILEIPPRWNSIFEPGLQNKHISLCLLALLLNTPEEWAKLEISRNTKWKISSIPICTRKIWRNSNHRDTSNAYMYRVSCSFEWMQVFFENEILFFATVLWNNPFAVISFRSLLMWITLLTEQYSSFFTEWKLHKIYIHRWDTNPHPSASYDISSEPHLVPSCPVEGQ